MGKSEDDQNLPANVASEVSERNARQRFSCCGCGRISGFVGLRCLLMLILSTAVILSGLFWLPPFRRGSDHKHLGLDPKFRGHEIVASFNVAKPASFLYENSLQLQKDIFDEISFASIKIGILALEPSVGSNITKVVFGVDPDTKYSKISPLSQSLIRESFEALVANQSSLQLTKSLFGETFLFEVLKFPGGITVIPPQSAFLLQKVQIRFNFTLNFSIYQIQINFNALTSQLKKGLHLAPYENLYVSLSNSEGSTVSPPTTVQSSVLLAVGLTPLMPRLKQLAQTITGSHSRNLGLNNTVFGKVKQVHLSSILQHSLHGGNSGATSQSPSPLPHIHHHHHHLRHHHHHHHHQQHHHHNAYVAPEISPAPASRKGSSAPPKRAPAPTGFSPTPQKSHKKSQFAPPPCQNGNKRRQRGNTNEKHSHLAPRAAPTFPPHYSALSPQQESHSPAPTPASKSHLVPTSSPLPHVVFAHAPPQHPSELDKQHSNEVASNPPASSSSCAGSPTVQWAVLLFLIAAMLNV